MIKNVEEEKKVMEDLVDIPLEILENGEEYFPEAFTLCGISFSASITKMEL